MAAHKRPDIESMSLGDEVVVPTTFGTEHKWESGKVVYIHPKKRFYTVEFTFGVRESYCAKGELSDRRESIRHAGKV